MTIPIPAGMEQAEVTWTLGHTTQGESLAGARGFVRFEPTAHAVAFPSMTVLPRPVEARVVAGVMEPVELMVNDPELWNWRVVPEVGVPWTPFHVDVLGPVDLATVVVVPGKGPIRAVKGEKGDTPTWDDLPGKPSSFPSTIPEVEGLEDALDGKGPAPVEVAAALGPGASAGAVRLTQSGGVVVATATGLVLTGTSEVVATIPPGWAPPHKAGHGYLEDTVNGWWPTRATTTSIQVMGPAPAGTTVEGSIAWSL